MRMNWSSGAAALGLGIAMSGCGGSDESDEGTPKGDIEYLALGDSIAYGDDGFVPHTAEARPNGDAFVGYPDLVGRDVFGGHYANLGCPGATTASYLSLTGEDNGCREFQDTLLNTMHVPYTSAQADKADEIFDENDIRVVTLTLGGNDLLITLRRCSELTPDDPDATLECALAELPQTVREGAIHLAVAFQRIRDKFAGDLVYVNVYSTFPADDPATEAVTAWNNVIASTSGGADVQIVDAFSIFAQEAEAAGGDPCAAGLLIPNPVEGATPACDVHPSPEGARLLADAVRALPGVGP